MSTTAPTFEQSGKPIRKGSEVLIAYAAGDADVGMVTGIEQTRDEPIVWVAIPGQTPKAFGADELAPFEEQDYADDLIRDRLEYLRGEIRAERISYGEIAELQGLAEFIDASDVELLEWAGVSEEDALERMRREERSGLAGYHTTSTKS